MAFAGHLLCLAKRAHVRTLGAFLRLSRLTFLAGGVAGGALGTAVAAYETGTVDWRAYALAQFTISSFHLMTHYANDYFDRAGDARAVRTAFSGGSGALVDGSLPARVALWAALACAAGGMLGTLGLVRAHADVAAGLAVAMLLLAWSYSAPPLRLLARGLGELDTVLVVAVLVPLCAYAAQRGSVDARAIAAALPAAAALFAMMLAVQFPDITADAACGKRNLLVRFGAASGARFGTFAAATIYATAILGHAFGAPLGALLALAASVPLAFGYVAALRRRGTGDESDPEGLAGRGVALFFIVSVFGALGYGAVARPPAEGRTGAETNPGAGMVEPLMTETRALFERANAALEAVRPAIQRDGGDVWLIRIDGNVAYVQMVGACGGCPMSNATLRGGIEAAIVGACSEITSVEQV